MLPHRLRYCYCCKKGNHFIANCLLKKKHEVHYGGIIGTKHPGIQNAEIAPTTTQNNKAVASVSADSDDELELVFADGKLEVVPRQTNTPSTSQMPTLTQSNEAAASVSVDSDDDLEPVFVDNGTLEVVPWQASTPSTSQVPPRINRGRLPLITVNIDQPRRVEWPVTIEAGRPSPPQVQQARQVRQVQQAQPRDDSFVIDGELARHMAIQQVERLERNNEAIERIQGQLRSLQRDNATTKALFDKIRKL